jgi:hypothetical protein
LLEARRLGQQAMGGGHARAVAELSRGMGAIHHQLNHRGEVVGAAPLALSDQGLDAGPERRLAGDFVDAGGGVAAVAGRHPRLFQAQPVGHALGHSLDLQSVRNAHDLSQIAVFTYCNVRQRSRDFIHR